MVYACQTSLHEDRVKMLNSQLGSMPSLCPLVEKTVHLPLSTQVFNQWGKHMLGISLAESGVGYSHLWTHTNWHLLLPCLSKFFWVNFCCVT